MIPFVNNSRLLISLGMTGATQNLYTGLHEFCDMGFLLHALRPGDLFVDVGANVGTYTILASRAIGAHVISFEPIPATFESLLDNIYLNRAIELVDARNVAVSRAPGTLRITSSLDTMNHVLSGDESASAVLDVPAVTLDSILEVSVPFLIKMDVEGFETEVVAGATHTLKKGSLKALIVETNQSGLRYGTNDQTIDRQIRSFGFLPFTYDPHTRSLIELCGPAMISGNTIYIRDVEFVRQRLKTAPAFAIRDKRI